MQDFSKAARGNMFASLLVVAGACGSALAHADPVYVQQQLYDALGRGDAGAATALFTVMTKHMVVMVMLGSLLGGCVVGLGGDFHGGGSRGYHHHDWR